MSVEHLLPTFEHFDASLFDPSLLLGDMKLPIASAASSATSSPLYAAASSSASSSAPTTPGSQQQQPLPHPLLLNFTQMQQHSQETMSDLSSTTGDEDMSGFDSTLPLSHTFDFLQEMVPGSPDTETSSNGGGSPFVHYTDYCPSPLGPNAESFDRAFSASSADGTRPVRQVRLQGSIRRRYEQLMPELAEQNKKKLNKRRKKAPLDLTKLTKADKEALENDRLEKNRQSARDCRLRKKFYIKSLEQKVEEYEVREQQRLADLDQATRELEEVRKRYELLLKHYQQVQPFTTASYSAPQ